MLKQSLVNNKQDKITLLQNIECRSIMEIAEDATYEGIDTGVCMNPSCEYTTSVEPDCADGYCKLCRTKTVKSSCILLGII